MLLYHPFFDTHHCVFRMLRLLQKMGDIVVEMDRFRVWDFYLLFPTALDEVQLPRGATGIRKEIRKLGNRYEVIPDNRRAFSRLETIQSAALAHLASVELISSTDLKERQIRRTANALPAELFQMIQQRNSEDRVTIDFLTTTFLQLPVFGPGGLRVRTDLFDHRYDLP